MNRDIHVQKGSDYLLKLELLGSNNTQYIFDDKDELHLTFSDIKGSNVKSVEVDLKDFENPLVHKITSVFLDQYTSNPIKYNLILKKENITLTLISGGIYRES